MIPVLAFFMGITVTLTVILLFYVSTLSRVIRVMSTQFANLQQAVDTLTATVTAEDTVIDGAVTLITSIPQLITSAVNDALAKGAPPSTLSAFSTLNDVILQKRDALANAIASTPTGEPAANPTSGGSDSSTSGDATGGDSSNTSESTTGGDSSAT